MTVGIANNDPTIRLGRDELLEQRAKGLAILFVEAINSAARGDLGNDIVSDKMTVQNKELAVEVIQKHQGQVIKAIGVSVIAEFADPLAAVRAAVDIEREMAESSQTISRDGQLALRIGIHCHIGDSRGIELLDGTVRAAAGIAKHAVPGQILISSQVWDALSKESNLHFQWFRKVIIEGQAETEDIFEVHWAATPAGIPARYQALFQVGMGGMGLVYKVRDQETHEIVALKVLRSEISSDPAMQENLRREVCLARKVTHKNVCRIHEFSRSNGVAYISMEFVEGASLHSKLQQSGPLPWNQALQIARQVCAGLGEAHAQGIVHRDLKPANIMLDRNGVAKIMDFGIARPFQGTGQITRTLIGTPAYMAPEQVELKGVDARTDVYALGLLLYEMVTGSQAFEGDTPVAVAIKQVKALPKRPREIVPILPAHAEVVILKCLEKNPGKRFQSMEELAAALRTNTQAKPAVSSWKEFLNDWRSYGRDLRQVVRPWVQAGGQYLRRQDWRSLTNKNMQRALAAGLGVACLAGGLAIFTLRSTRRHQTIAWASMGAPVATPIQGSQLPAQKITAANDADGLAPSISTLEVGPDPGSHPGSQEKSTSDPGSSSEGLSNSESIRINQRKRTQPAVKASVQPLAVQMAVSSPVAMETPSSDASSTSHTDAAGSSEPNTESTSPNPAESHFAATPPATSGGPAAGGKTTDDNPASASHFFEVGSFKDSTWADQAVAKLTQLGFHAISVRRNFLWVRSYQVQVGPYVDPKDMEAAIQDLTSQGFKPHPVK